MITMQKWLTATNPETGEPMEVLCTSREAEYAIINVHVNGSVKRFRFEMPDEINALEKFVAAITAAGEENYAAGMDLILLKAQARLVAAANRLN